MGLLHFSSNKIERIWSDFTTIFGKRYSHESFLRIFCSYKMSNEFSVKETMMRTMFYPKNVPNAERIGRILLGILLIGVGLFTNQVLLIAGTLIFSAVFIIGTGFIGWCPACAMMGRKIKTKSSKPA
jgi:hypothetical protein